MADRVELSWGDEARRDEALLRVLEAAHRTPWPSDCDISPTELRVVDAASHGLQDDEISLVLGLTLFTVKAQMKGAMRKLAAKNRAHAVAKALRRELIQ